MSRLRKFCNSLAGGGQIWTSRELMEQGLNDEGVINEMCLNYEYNEKRGIKQKLGGDVWL